MIDLPYWFRAGAILLLAAPLLRGQNALYAEHNGGARLVRRVVRSDPYVDDGTGKLVLASGDKYGLGPAPEYAPVYVSIRHLKVETRALELMENGAEINREFSFRGEFESPYPLKNVFVVLDMNTEDAGKTLFVREVGNLEPRELRSVEITLRLNQHLGAGHYNLHLFSDGAEVFHSEMPFNLVEHKLDQIVRRRVKGLTDSPPRPFIGPAPEYPEKLRRAKVQGSAMIRFTISPNGRVLDPEVKSASDPAFGEAALAAARQWRFLPKVKGGTPVSSAAQMPFTFGAESKPADTTAK
jgi:TonB family protein